MYNNIITHRPCFEQLLPTVPQMFPAFPYFVFHAVSFPGMINLTHIPRTLPACLLVSIPCLHELFSPLRRSTASGAAVAMMEMRLFVFFCF
jgi:hypothetical protein